MISHAYVQSRLVVILLLALLSRRFLPKWVDKVKKIEGTDLFLAYDGKMGIDLLVSPAISYAKKLVPEKAGWVEQMPGNIVKLRLGDIDKLQKVFEKLKLDKILFEPGNIGIEMSLVY